MDSASGIRLQGAVSVEETAEIVDLLEGQYWLSGVPRTEIGAAVLASTATVAARDSSGALVAFARAVSDGKCAWIYDVVVAESVRGSRVGSAVMEMLLNHPTVRSARHVRLTTRDAMSFYERLGFRDIVEVPLRPWKVTEMIRSRA
jgi:N-acetylglutamate synthase-like GNAT family acetyltransferase